MPSFFQTCSLPRWRACSLFIQTYHMRDRTEPLCLGIPHYNSHLKNAHLSRPETNAQRYTFEKVSVTAAVVLVLMDLPKIHRTRPNIPHKPHVVQGTWPSYRSRKVPSARLGHRHT